MMNLHFPGLTSSVTALGKEEGAARDDIYHLKVGAAGSLGSVHLSAKTENETQDSTCSAVSISIGMRHSES